MNKTKYSYSGILTFLPPVLHASFLLFLELHVSGALPTVVSLRAEFWVDGAMDVSKLGCENGSETIWNCDMSHSIAHKKQVDYYAVLNDHVKRGHCFVGSFFIQKGDTFY